MGLVFPANPNEIDRNKPGTHALIAGVSSYPHLRKGKGSLGPYHFGMKQLTVSALSAFRICEWVVQQRDRFHPPLASCRLLISPSEKEQTQILNEQRNTLRAATFEDCNIQNFLKDAKEWREDASGSPESMALFYFAGHGLQTREVECALLLQDFNDGQGGVLRAAVDLDNIYGGMAPAKARPDIARNQLYFFDACRFRPDEQNQFLRMNTTDVFPVEFDTDKGDGSAIVVDDRRAPILYAAVPGGSAYSAWNKYTFFSHALLSCFKGRAGVKVQNPYGQTEWLVTAHSLSAALTFELDDINRARKLALNHTMNGKNLTILTLDGAPSADVVIEVEPASVSDVSNIDVLNDAKKKVWQLKSPLKPYPPRNAVPPGQYTLNTKIAPERYPFADTENQIREAVPP